MTLEDLLAELRDNILHDRSDRVSGATDYLWSDATLIRYINEAQRRLARRGLVIRDGTTPAVCEVTLVEDQETYDLHPSVVAVISAKLDGDVADLGRTGHAMLNAYRPADGLYWDPGALTSLPPGKPLAFSTDEETGVDGDDIAQLVKLRVYPAPGPDYAGDTLRLRVVRLPIEELTTRTLKAKPEIPEDYHLDMLDWAAYLALRIVDRDGEDRGRAADFRASFEDHVREARRSSMRKLFAPTPWGFGRNGWTWG
jgi:hypothetical protein